MQGINWNKIAILVIAVVCHTCLAAPSLRIKRSDENIVSLSDNGELSPITSDDLNADGLDRDKRKVTEAFQSKNAILGFVFGSSGKLISSASRPVTKAPPIKTTTDDTPDFDRGKVSLDIPDELFGSSFKTVTNVSKIFGDLIMNSARRYAQFVNFFKPLVGPALTVKGYNAPTTVKTTTVSFNDI